jgi:trimethylamine corrinoid protein
LQKELFDELKNAIISVDVEKAREAAKKIVEAKIDPVAAIKGPIEEASKIVGSKFECGEYFLPHLVLAGNAMDAAVEVLQTAMPKGQVTGKTTILMATVQGDIHSIGKNIVGMSLRVAGFNVVDIGVDVKSDTIVDKAVENGAQMIALSCLLTTSMPYQREVLEQLKATNLRDRFKVAVGGGPVTLDWANQIGADAYGKDAVDGVEACKKALHTQ